MVFIYFVLYGLLGAVTGSFLNVCILRIPENQNFVTGRSHCPACAIYWLFTIWFLFCPGYS